MAVNHQASVPGFRNVDPKRSAIDGPGLNSRLGKRGCSKSRENKADCKMFHTWDEGMQSDGTVSTRWQEETNGGEGEIRTPGPREGSTVFETAAIDHSATSPRHLILACMRFWPAESVKSNKLIHYRTPRQRRYGRILFDWPVSDIATPHAGSADPKEAECPTTSAREFRFMQSPARFRRSTFSGSTPV